MGRKAGLSDEKLHVVRGDDMTPFNNTERLVIELADALTNTPSNVPDDLYARLRNQFSEEQLMQLGAQIAFRELSRTLESNFQCRERKFIQAAAKQIVTITTSLSALMCLPHRAVFRLVNSATRL